MPNDLIRVLAEALEAPERITQPPTKPNRSVLDFLNASEPITVVEAMTVEITTNPWPAKWGTTVVGPNGGNWKWNLAGKWRAGVPDVVLADSPAGYWRLDESSGLTAHDKSGNGRHGTYVGAVTLGETSTLAGDTDTAISLSNA